MPRDDPNAIVITIVKVFAGDDPAPLGSLRDWYADRPIPEGWRHLLDDGTIRHERRA